MRAVAGDLLITELQGGAWCGAYQTPSTKKSASQGANNCSGFAIRKNDRVVRGCFSEELSVE